MNKWYILNENSTFVKHMKFCLTIKEILDNFFKNCVIDTANTQIRIIFREETITSSYDQAINSASL